VISGVLIGLLTLIAATIFGRKPSALKKTAAKA
jgi:hypothetical protein